MVITRLAERRLYNQHLEGAKLRTAAEVVESLGAVQAQEYALAKWALGLRMQSATDNTIEAAFNAGHVLRTHVMRPTWHFVTPADIRWLLELTAPRVHQVNGTMYRKLELHDGLLCRCADTLARSLEGGRHLTRAELGELLGQQGIDTRNGMRLGYILHYAELEAIICSGARRGSQHTYALLAERAPGAKRLSRGEALTELALRYFSSHGPATVKDCARWSGLTLADVKAGIAQLDGVLSREMIDGDTYWFNSSTQQADTPSFGSHLLPVYDEFTIGYRNHSAVLNPIYAQLVADRFFTSPFVHRGEIIGMWRRTFKGKRVLIELAPFRPFAPEEMQAFEAAARRLGAFLGMDIQDIHLRPG